MLPELLRDFPTRTELVGRPDVYDAARAGVKIENTGSEPLVGLRYFGPDVHANLPKIGGK